MLLRSYLNRFVHHTASILTPTALSYIFSTGESNYFRKVATVVSMFSPFLNFEFHAPFKMLQFYTITMIVILAGGIFQLML